jgi:general secretion pathway protein G
MSTIRKKIRRLREREEGFTLIELMIVIVILGILAGVVGTQVMKQPDKAKVAAAKAEISVLESSLQHYALDVGDYPASEDGLQALWQAPESAENWDGPYIQKPDFTDPWGNLYIYVYPGTHEDEGYDYDLFSYGKDGKEGGESYDADVTNWIETEDTF